MRTNKGRVTRGIRKHGTIAGSSAPSLRSRCHGPAEEHSITAGKGRQRRPLSTWATIATMALATSAMGGARVVDSIGDSGPGSLRQAIADAAPGETITFAPALDGASIILTDGQLTIATNLTIDASALRRGVTIDAGYATSPQRVLQVTAGARVVLHTLTITGGMTPEAYFSTPAGEGGGIHNAGTLTLRHVRVTDNQTGYGGDYTRYGGIGGAGGGIYNSGDLTIESSTISHNRTGSGGDGYGPSGDDRGDHSYPYYEPDDELGGYGGPGGPGGGICNVGTLTLRNATIAHNSCGRGGDGLHSIYDHEWETEGKRGGAGGAGGGIYNAGTFTIENASIFGNTTGEGGGGTGAGGVGGAGGGICQSAGILAIEAATISGNTTGEGIDFGGSGGGIFLDGGILTLRNSTICNNTTGFGGFRGGSAAGIYNNGGDLTIRNSTISDNATGEGLVYPGGIGGVYNSTGSVTFENSIVAGNHAALGEPNLENWTGTLRFAGNNLTSGDPLLAPLGLHGGPTRTMEPLPGSPAIDAGVPTANTPATDQRGLPRIAGVGLDLGAFETGNLTGYAAWAAMHIPAGLDASFTGDADGNGRGNGLEFGTGPDGHVSFSLGPDGARVSFGYRPEAEGDLIWRVVRSTDLQTFAEVLRIEGGVPTVSPGNQLLGAPPTYIFLDSNPPSGAAYYRLELELITP